MRKAQKEQKRIQGSSLLMIINGYSGKEGLMEAGKYAVSLLNKYVSAINVEIKQITKDSAVYMYF